MRNTSTCIIRQPATQQTYLWSEITLNQGADIAGANAAGWESFLVETGVYDPGSPPSHKPTEIVSDVEAAVKRGIELALEAEKTPTA